MPGIDQQRSVTALTLVEEALAGGSTDRQRMATIVALIYELLTQFVARRIACGYLINSCGAWPASHCALIKSSGMRSSTDMRKILW
jgi:hypothetical protein